MLCGTMWHFLYRLIFSTATPLGAPLMVGILPQNFVFGALSGPNEVLEMHLAPFLDQLKVYWSKKN